MAALDLKDLESILRVTVKVDAATSKASVGIERLGFAAKTANDQVGKLSGSLTSAFLGATQHDLQSFIAGMSGVADVFATTVVQAGGFKAAIAGLTAEALPLIATLGPLVLGLAAVGGAAWAVSSATEEHEKRIKALHRAIDDQSQKLSKAAPWLITTADNAYLAAEGQKNFEKYLAKTNGTLERQILLMRQAAIEGYRKDLQDAKANQKKAQTEFDRISTAGAHNATIGGFSTNVGSFSTASAAPSRASIEQSDKYKSAKKDLTKANDNVSKYKGLLDEALKVPKDEYGAAFAGQATQAEKLGGALDQLLPKLQQIKTIRDNIGTVQKALDAADRGDMTPLKSLKTTVGQAREAIAAGNKQIADLQKDGGPEGADRGARTAVNRASRASAALANANAVKLETETVAASNVVWAEASEIAVAYAEQQKAKAAAQNADIKTMDELVGGAIHLSSAMESLSIDFQNAAKISNQMSGAVTGIADSIKNNDWAGAFGGLFSLLDNVQKAFKDGQSSAEKFAAVTGLVQGVGKVIGGKAGAAIGGAANGAQAGFQMAGPWGAAIGAALGGVAGLLGASNAKAQAKIDALMKAQQDLQARQKESSGAIEKSLGLAGQYQNTDLDYSNAMLGSLRSIDGKIGVVAAGIARSIANGGLLSTSGLGLGSTVSQRGIGGGVLGGIAGAGLMSAAGVGTVAALGGTAFGWAATAALANPIGVAVVAVGALVGALTKTKKTVQVLDQGLTFSAQTFGQITTSGLAGSQYADLLTTKKTSIAGIGLSTKVSTSTVTSGVDPDLMAQITGVIEVLGEGVVTAAKTFGEAAGQAAQDALAGATIDLGKLSLKDLKPDEIEAAINAMFDKVADGLASAGVPALKDLAKVGEGAFETLTRLATEYKTIDSALASIGMDFKTKGLGSLGARENLLKSVGGLDAFTSQTAFFGEHFLTEDDRLKPLKASVATTLTAMGQPADLSREGFKKFVQGQDVSTKDGAALYAALMALAPAFDKVATAAETAKAAIDDQRTSIQDQIDELTKSPAELLAKSRDKEREAVKALDLSLVPLLENLWKLQDAADAAKLATDRSNAEADMLDAQGFTEQAKAKRRTLALADVKDPDQRTYMQRTWAAEDAAAKVSAARDVLTQAYHDEQDEILKTKDKFKELSDSLKAFSASLSDTIAGADLATRYRTTRQAFQATASLARTGNEDAMRRLQAEGEAFTSASRDYASTSIDYLRDVGLVRSAVDDAAAAADNQVSIAQKQLEALDASVSGLIKIDTSVISVRDAIANLQGALVEARAAGVGSVGGSNLGLTPTNTSSPSPTVQRDPTLANANMAWLLTHGMLAAANDTKPDDATKAYIALGNTYKPGYMDIVNTRGIEAANALVDAGKLSVLQGGSLNFATGGGFEVGGSGPPDSKLFNLALSPGEAVNVQRADQKGDRSLITELRRLREELADLRETSVRIANSNDKMERTLTNVTEGGRAMMTEAAA